MELDERDKRAPCYKSGINVPLLFKSGSAQSLWPLQANTALSPPRRSVHWLAMALRRIHYSQMQNFNVVMKAAEVRAFL